MVVGSCLKLVFRRLALRKGVAVSAACLFLLGVGLLYYQFSKNDEYSASNIGVRKIDVVWINSRHIIISIQYSLKNAYPIK